MLATKDGRFSRVAVFCDRRDKKDDGGGPSAQGVKEEIERLAKGDRKAGRAETKIHLVELLVGARRVHEREASAKRLRALGFIGERASNQRVIEAYARKYRGYSSDRGNLKYETISGRFVADDPVGCEPVSTPGNRENTGNFPKKWLQRRESKGIYRSKISNLFD